MNTLHDPRVATLRALAPGATAQVLMAFLMYPQRSLGNVDLQTLTGKTDKTITAALRALKALGLIQHHARYSGWMLTIVARQMLLGETEPGVLVQPEPREPENFRLDDSSSSSSDPASLTPINQLLPPQPTTREPENFRLPPEWDQVAGDLVRFCSIPPARAAEAVTAAMQRGDYPGQVLYEAYRWLSYCQEPENQGINNRSFFIASRIGDGTPCQADYRPSSRFQYWPRIIAARRQWMTAITNEAQRSTILNDLPDDLPGEMEMEF